MIIRVIIAILLICGAVGAQEKATTSTDTSFGRVSGVNTLLQISTGTALTIGTPPIIIDGESTDCTQAHLIKALKIAAAGLKDPNEPTGGYSFSTLECIGCYPQAPASRLRNEAERLRAEADRLEAESKRVQWVRDVMKACDEKQSDDKSVIITVTAPPGLIHLIDSDGHDVGRFDLDEQPVVIKKRKAQ